jgi:ribosome biogenesis protein BMS1
VVGSFIRPRDSRIDKVVGADIVFLRAWYSILPRKFYNPVTSLLLADKGEWRGMRLTGQVRRAEGLKTPLGVNSTYKVCIQLRHLKDPIITRVIGS